MIIGTAGHVNHGKTTLVQALTGVDCDTLEEEKRRGITIQLGYAAWQLPDGTQVSMVDVPGHASLGHTMATGSLGLDGVLLCVAADEGVKPQTREHIHACQVLGVQRAIVVVTCVDRAGDPGAAADQIGAALQDTWLSDAPRVCVSAVDRTGLEQLGKLALEHFTEPDRQDEPALLPIDRVFTVKGIGTVVTGSLVRGQLHAGDNLVLWPAADEVRARSLHVHGAAQQSVHSGHRVGVNLAGLPTTDVPRGSFLSAPRAMVLGSVFDVELHWLPHMEGAVKAASSLGYVCGAVRANARFHADAAIEPGHRGTARMVLDRQVPLSGGLRFVLRGSGHPQFGAVVGGGRILDAAPPRRRKGAVRQALWQGSTPTEVLVTEADRRGVDAAGLEARLGPGHGGEGQLFSEAALAGAEQALLAQVLAFHAQESQQAGIPLTELAATDGVRERALHRLLANEQLVREDSLVRSADHDVAGAKRSLSGLAAKLYELVCAQGLKALKEDQLAAQLGQPQGRVHDAVLALERDGRLVRSDGLCFGDLHVERIKRDVAQAVMDQGELPVAWLKDREQLTRKHAMPLWVLLDRSGVTQRKGNIRVPGKAAARWR